ncbi:MAG: T9SS C-terminal target domain-containing protein [Chryseobacterium sp.]|nr:MAG: T9SS C-terminal target domain-containing protein [Chryseobacterium sp.]
MKKIFTSLLVAAAISFAGAQSYWHPTAAQGVTLRSNVSVSKYYSLNIDAIKAKLANAELSSKGARAVEIELPTLDGKVERFAVYSRPVAEQSLVQKYGLGSYVGVGIDDPSKYLRFSLTGNDFQSMIIKNGKYQFIEPQNEAKTVYGVFGKAIPGGPRGFVCSMDEDILSKEQIDKLFNSSQPSFAKNDITAKASDQKMRTLRLAISVTGEYTQYFGGVAQALAQINATMTRVNGVYEKDAALHMIMIDKPELIYSDPSTDPYSPASQGAGGAWNMELQRTLTAVVGEENYDIGHLFGATGGGGNAGCIGCVCDSPNVNSSGVATSKAKGSAFTSPADGKPFGDNFDIDYVAHEFGHQLGANHTFSMNLEGTGVNMEPGSGSTIMGYAGITGATDVQQHSDPYFHTISISQMQANLAKTTKTCDVETTVANHPPVVPALLDVNIPKGTAFVLSGTATDPDGDVLEYNWEQVDNAATTINKTNLGNTTSGAAFRSKNSTETGVRYFPALNLVMDGKLRSPNDWESVSSVARTMNFRLTVRDNNPAGPQTQFGTQRVIVGNDGPFTVNTAKAYTNSATPIMWAVANTDAAPYNVANVKIDYTTDNGSTWTVLSESVPNNGVAMLTIPGSAINQNAKVRVSAVGNIFYAVSPVLTAATAAPFDGTAPKQIKVDVSTLTQTAVTINWDMIANATYVVRYRPTSGSGKAESWTTVTTAVPTITLTGLEDETQYEVQVAAVAGGTQTPFSDSISFKTLSVQYCTLFSSNSTDEWITNVKVNNMSSDSGASNYTDYTADPARMVKLQAGSTDNTISVKKAWKSTQYNEGVTAWIDFNRDGEFTESERIIFNGPNKDNPVSNTFTVPADAYTGGKTLKMRVVLRYNAAQTSACGTINYGEVEDYAVTITDDLTTTEVGAKNNGLNVFPNPAVDVLNVTKASANASYSIHNAEGRVVMSGKLADGKVGVSKLAKGVYVISVDDNGQISKVKFIKK